MRIVYFAKVRETIGCSEEERQVPADLSVAGLIEQLAGEKASYASAFSDPARLRFALDQCLVSPTTLIGASKELAIFPPVTGG